MKNPKETPINVLIRDVQPWALVAGVITYALGCGIVKYLGHPIDWSVYWLGQALVTMMQASGYLLSSYYDELENVRRGISNRNVTPGDPPAISISQVLLAASLTVLSVGAVLTVLMIARGVLNATSLVILGISFVLTFFYAVPPVRLVYSGYGELVEAILVTNLFTALGYLFQVGEMHRLILMLSLPLTAMYLAMKVAFALPAYSENLKQSRDTLVTRMGWQRGMNAHNLLILISFLLLGVAALLGLPWVLTWPALLVLPIGVFQIWRMVQIANGAAPRWRSFLFLSAGIVGLMAYLFTLALWTA
jgi:1,4-dihydroxy-2-naphthoate octaprenyltransferase